MSYTDFRIITPWSNVRRFDDLSLRAPKTLVFENTRDVRTEAPVGENIEKSIEIPDKRQCECNSAKLEEMMIEIRTLQDTLSKFEEILREDEEIAFHIANEQIRLENVKQDAIAKMARI